MKKENGLYNHHVTLSVSDSTGKRVYCEVIIPSYSKILAEADLIDVKEQTKQDFKEKYKIKGSLESITVVVVSYFVTK